jgi:hypothetical protein
MHNLGMVSPGHFEDVTAAAGVEMLDLSFGRVVSFASQFVDFDADGHLDLAVASDFGTSHLFWSRGDGTFEDGTHAAGVGTDENGMGTTTADIDGDGLVDWFVSAIYEPPYDSGNRLYRNRGDRTFDDVTDPARVRDGGWGWGSAFFDFDNDGDEDLVMTSGQDYCGYDFAHLDQPMRLFVNDGTGHFTEAAQRLGLVDRRNGKGLLVFDYDGDGDEDVFVVNTRDEPVLYRNDVGQTNHFLRVRVRSDGPNHLGVGARVTIHASGRIREKAIDGGCGFLAQRESIAHFGLGRVARVDEVRVELPWSGAEIVLEDVAVDQVLTVRAP